MRFPPSLLDEIRAALPVSQIVARHVKLRRQGREYAGLSPFKHEKTPSFFVNDEKGFYHCFASGEHGDIFAFMTAIEGLSFPEAVERLAAEAGIALPKASPEAEAREEVGARLRKLLEVACAFFQEALRSEAGANARHYIERRGVTAVEVGSFRLGYAPAERHALKEHLAARGFATDDMIAAGVLIAGDDIPVSYDRFRNRVIFPITDLRGQVIAFGGRALDARQQPKYLNSPETPLFRKGAVLFNAASARPDAHERGSVVVAEGYMDVIALARAGFPNAVAPLGTALTADQLQMLWRMAPEPVLCFDGDSAGQKAAHRAVETALPLLKPGRSLAFSFLPDGLDPDDLMCQQGGRAVADALARARPLVDVLWAKELAAGIWDTPERRARLQSRLAELTNTIADRAVRAHYEQAMRRRLHAQFAPPAASAPRRNTAGATGRARAKGRPAPVRPVYSLSLADNALARAQPTGWPRREALILLALLNHPWLMDSELEHVAAIGFESQTLRDLRDRIVALYYEGRASDRETLHHELQRSGHAGTVARIGEAIMRGLDLDVCPSASREDVQRGWHERLAMQRKAVELPAELEAAERGLAAEFTEQQYFRVLDLHTQLHAGSDGT
jgi:DNA primase